MLVSAPCGWRDNTVKICMSYIKDCMHNSREQCICWCYMSYSFHLNAWNIQCKSNNVRVIKYWQINTVFIVTLDIIRSVTVGALCVMLLQLWWTQKLSVKKKTQSHCSDGLMLTVWSVNPNQRSNPSKPYHTSCDMVQTVTDWPHTPLHTHPPPPHLPSLNYRMWP